MTYATYPLHSCGTCAYRAYGDERMISQCRLKVHGRPPAMPAPRARDFGQKCKAFAMSIDAAEELGVPFGHPDRPVASGKTEAETARNAERKEAIRSKSIATMRTEE